MKKTTVWIVLVVILCVSLGSCIIGESTRQDQEPNNTMSSANSLGTIEEIAVNGKLDTSDREDWYSFNNDSHRYIDTEIIELGSLEISWALHRNSGATPVDSASYGGTNVYDNGSTTSNNFQLQIKLDTYSDGGDYILLIKCR